MKFKCSFCDNKGQLSGFNNQPSSFLLAPWYQDEKGYNHEMIVCNECGCIHDVKVSFLKLLVSWATGNPYKLLGNITLLESSKMIVDKMKLYELNCRSIAYHDYGINEQIINHMVNTKLWGDSFISPLCEESLFVSRKNDVIAKRIRETNFN